MIPDGYNSWLDFAISTMDTRTEYLSRIAEGKNEMSREDMRLAAKKELDELITIIKHINDDDLAMQVAKECHDPAHDKRWCSTCEARFDGISEYRDKIKSLLEAKT